MRTKTLLLTAVLGVAAAATSMADVFSVNVVGYVNVDVPAGGFALVCNPLNGTNNTLNTILPDAPNNTTIAYEFDSGSGLFITYTKRSSGWAGADGVSFNPGKGFFIQNNAAAPITLTFVGEVPQGTNTVSYGTAFSLISGQFPKSGLVETDLGLPAVNGDIIYQFDKGSQTYVTFTRRATGWGGGLEPSIGVGEGFFIQTSTAGTNWTRSFSVN